MVAWISGNTTPISENAGNNEMHGRSPLRFTTDDRHWGDPRDFYRSVDQMRTLLLAATLSLVFASPAFATVQANDSVSVGGKTYGIFQLPMNSLLRYEHERPDDRELFPPFEAPHTANHRGYIAQFAIANGRLYLNSIKGRIDGKDVADRDIIDKRFPVRAHWYTGSIFISVGGYDQLEERFRYVIEFSIERGKVVATRYSDLRRIPITWNGLDAPSPTTETTEPADARESPN